MTARVFLHLGLHKTATTTLQQQLFPHIPNLLYLGVQQPHVRHFIDRTTKQDPIYFDFQQAAALLQIHQEDKTILLSAESFSGPPFSGEREWGLDHRKSVLDNLHAVFPQAGVILVLRRQDGYAVSMYRQYLKFGGTQSMKRFFGLDTEGDRFGLFSLDRLDYLPYVRYLHDLFSGRVQVLLFEDFVRNPDFFFGKLEGFMEMPLPRPPLGKTNATRLGPAGLEITRRLNYLFRSIHNPGGLVAGLPALRNGKFAWVNPMPLIHDRWPGKGRLPQESAIQRLAKTLLERNMESNQLLDQSYSLGMERHGYY